VPTPAFLIALLQAKADGDDESVAELRDVMADGEHAAALLEQVAGEEEPDAPVEKAFREGDPPAATVVDLLREATEDERSGLKVYYASAGPMYWIDQMDWHDGDLGKRVIAAAEESLGVEAEEGYRHTRDAESGDRKSPPVQKAVWVFNEAADPQKLPGGEMWDDLTDGTHR